MLLVKYLSDVCLIIILLFTAALIILGCGLLISGVTFICEVLPSTVCRVSPSSPNLATKRRTWDVLQIIVALILLVPSIIFLSVACYDFIKDYDT